jgi:glutathione S-transferase
MLKIYGFGPAPGLPDFSPYVIKAMTLLKIAGVDYVAEKGSPGRAPKGKLPYIDDDGVIVPDSTLIRFHIEQTRDVDFDSGLSAEQRAQSWAIEKFCEDHLSSITAVLRWRDEANFEKGVGAFFDKVLPAPLRPVKWLVRRGILKRLYKSGIARFTPAEIDLLGVRDVETLATLIGDKPYLMGDKPCAADASVFAALALLLDPASGSKARDAALATPNLVAYRDRMMGRYFPECV